MEVVVAAEPNVGLEVPEPKKLSGFGASARGLPSGVVCMASAAPPALPPNKVGV